MGRVPFNIANDWLRHPQLWRPVSWRPASGEDYIIFQAEVDGALWTVRLNDFPEQPCHTVLIDGNEVMHFDDWPSIWIRPEFPKNDQR